MRSRAAEVNAVLSQNVLAALYRAAVDGNVTAMSVWLKANPPAGWGEARDETAAPVTFDELLKDLTYDELRQLGESVGCPLPDQAA